MASSAASITITAKDEAGNVLSGIARSLSALKGAGEEARGGISSLGSALSSLKEHIGTGAAIATGIGLVNTAMGALSHTMGGVKDAFIGINEQLDASKVAFTGMLGSGQAAGAMMKQLQTIAAQTPFEFPQLVTATQHLMSFGFTAQQTIPLLKDIGNASSYFGTGAEGINRMVLAMGQMHAGVTLHTQDLDQLIQVGVPVWNILAEGTGKTTGELQKMVSNGQIASDTFIQYFDQWVQKTPGVVDAMQKQSTTFAGAMSTIHDNATMAIASGLRPLFDLITEGANKIAQFTESDRFQSWVLMVQTGAGRAADAIRGLFTTFQAEGLDGVLNNLKTKVTNFFESFTGAGAHTGGFNFIVTFAQGMYDAAQGVLTTVINDITSYIGDFFIGKSPPAKGPLKDIQKGGATLMDSYADGMIEGTKGNTKVTQAAQFLLTAINDTLAGNVAGPGVGSMDFSGLTDSIRSGTMSMDELKAAGEGVNDVVRLIGESITDIQDQQDVLKGQIDDIKFSYEDQIDPLQKQLDALKNVVDWTAKQRDLELEIAKNKIDQAEAADPTLKGLNTTLAGLQSQQRTGRTAPIDRTLENRIASLQQQERGLPAGQAGAARRKQLEDTIAGIREQARTQGNADTDASRALQGRIDKVKQDIDNRKATYQAQLDANKAEKDSVDLKAKGLDLERQLKELPLEKKIADLKQAEQDRIAPLQRQYDLLDRQRQLLERQKQHWSEIGQEIKDALQPLTEALQLQSKLDAEAKASAPKTGAAKTGAAGLLAPTPLQLRGQETGTGNPLGDAMTGGAKAGASQIAFDTMGAKIGESITNGAVNFIKDHFGSLVGTAIGGALGEAVLGPPGAVIGGLLGGRIGDELQKKLSGTDWQAKLAPISEGFGRFFTTLQDEYKHKGMRGVVDDLLAAVQEAAPKIGEKLISWAEKFVDFIKPFLGPMLQALGGLIASLYKWLLDQAPGIQDKLLKWADEFVHWIAPQIPKILLELGKLWLQLELFLGETVLKLSAQLLKWGAELVAWVAPKIPPLLEELGKLALKLLGWVKDQIPDLIITLAGWAGEFIAWAPTVFPKLLIKLGELLGDLTGWVVTTGVPELKDKIAQWVPAFMSWVGSLLDPSNADGVEQKLLTIGKTITEWITDFTTKVLAPAAEAFIKPFLAPFDKIMAGIKEFTGFIGRALSFLTKPLQIGSIVAEGGFGEAPPKLYAAGGRIDEEVHGLGMRSGRKYVFGERGSEMVVPLGRGGPLEVAKSATEHVGQLAGGAADAVRSFVGKGAELAVDEAFKSAGVSLNLGSGFAAFGTAILTQLKNGILDLARSLFSEIKQHFPQPAPGTSGGGALTTYDYTGDDSVVRAALSMLSSDGALWNGWCEKFVGNVADAVGAGRPRMRSALVHANSIGLNPGWGPPGSVQYWTGGPDGHVDINGPNPGEGISTGSWGIGVVGQSRFGGTAGWAPIQLADGGIVQREGVYHLHRNEAVIPLDRAQGRVGATVINVTVAVAGTVVSEGQLVDAVHQGLLKKQRRTGKLGLS